MLVGNISMMYNHGDIFENPFFPFHIPMGEGFGQRRWDLKECGEEVWFFYLRPTGDIVPEGRFTKNGYKTLPGKMLAEMTHMNYAGWRATNMEPLFAKGLDEIFYEQPHKFSLTLAKEIHEFIDLISFPLGKHEIGPNLF